MSAKFYENDGKLFFTMQHRSHVSGIPGDVIDDKATEQHIKSYPGEYAEFLKSKEPVIEVVEEVVEEKPVKKGIMKRLLNKDE